MWLGADVQPDLTVFDARSVTLASVQQAAGRSGANVILLSDACYSGQARGGGALAEGKRFAVPQYATRAEPTVLEWSAAGPSQWSSPLDTARHGAFTYAMLGALRGWADGVLDGQRDGKVTAAEAELYVEKALRELDVRDQRPVLAVSNGGSWVLSTATEPAPQGLAPGPAASSGTGAMTIPAGLTGAGVDPALAQQLIAQLGAAQGPATADAEGLMALQAFRREHVTPVTWVKGYGIVDGDGKRVDYRMLRDIASLDYEGQQHVKAVKGNSAGIAITASIAIASSVPMMVGMGTGIQNDFQLGSLLSFAGGSAGVVVGLVSMGGQLALSNHNAKEMLPTVNRIIESQPATP